MKKKIHTKIFCGLTAMLFALSGCGSGVSNPGVAEGMDAIAAMDYKGALDAFRTAAENGEDERLILRGIGIADIGLTDYDGAVENLLACLRAGSGFPTDMDYDTNFYLAAAYQKAERYQEAEEVYDAILALHSADADAYYLRGNARLCQERYQDAKEDFDMVVALKPNDFDMLLRIYEVLAFAGYKTPAVEYLQTALDTRSEKMSAYDKGRIQYHLGNYNEAQVLLEQAKEKGGAEVYLYLGMAYEATGDYNYAISNVYLNFLNRNDGNAEIYNQLGLCYLKQKEYEAALEAFQNAMQMEDVGIMQTLRYNEIVTYEYLGQYTQAYVLLENYLNNYPDDTAAQREFEFLRSR